MSDRRTEFDEKTRLKRLKHCDFKCEGLVTREDGAKLRCNATLVKGRVEFDHDIAAELGGPATFENCRALCKICHRFKYPSDAAKIAKAKRCEIADLGASAPSSHPMNSPQKPKRESRPVANGMPQIYRQFRSAT